MSGIDIEAVLSAHSYELNYRNGSICLCGFVPTVNPETLATQQDYHRAHVAAVLRTQIEGALAEAWDEAADAADSVGHHWSGAPARAFFALAGDFRTLAAHLSSDTERAGGAE